jgi:hypothetical protein
MNLEQSDRQIIHDELIGTIAQPRNAFVPGTVALGREFLARSPLINSLE